MRRRSVPSDGPIELLNFQDSIITELSEIRVSGMRTRRMSVLPSLPEPQLIQSGYSSSEPDSPSSSPSPLSIEAALQRKSNGGTKRKRGRGPTLMRDLWDDGERKVVSFNSSGQPNDPEVSNKLANFMGTIARDGKLAPLHYLTWRKMPEKYKEQMVELVKLKFEIPTEDDDFIVKSISKKWRNWKSIVKKMYYDPKLPIEEQLENVPDRVEADQWKELLAYWSSEEGKDASRRNTEIRKHQKIVHRTGTRSFAVMREITQEKLGRDPSCTDMFMACFAKPDGTPLNEEAAEKIEKMKEVFGLEADGSTSVDHDDLFTELMGKDMPGFLRTYGTSSTSSNVRGSIPSRSKCYTMAMKYKSKLESIERQYGELNKKLEVLQSKENNGNLADSSVQAATMDNQNHLSSSTSDSRALKVPILCEAVWPAQLVEVLCKLCIEQIDRGQCPRTQFPEKVWEDMSSKFEAQTGRKYDTAQLKSKWDILKGDWEKWKQLIDGEIELGWDLPKNTINATDGWWEQKFQINPEFKRFRTEGIPPDLEVLLDHIFMNAISTGNDVRIPSEELPSNWNDDDMSNDNDHDTPDIYCSDDINSNSHSGRKDADEIQIVGEPSLKKAKKHGKLNKLSSKLIGKKKNKKKKVHGTSGFKGKSTIPSQTPQDEMDPSIAAYNEIMELLDSIPEVEQNDKLHFFTLDHLKERLNQMIFKNLKSNEKKVNWLKHEYRKQYHR